MSENTPTPDGLTAHELCRCQLCRDLERSCCALCKLTWPCAGYFRENAEQAWQTVIEQKAHIAALEQVIKSNQVTNDLQSENAQLRRANGELVQSLAAAEAARREAEERLAEEQAQHQATGAALGIASTHLDGLMVLNDELEAKLAAAEADAARVRGVIQEAIKRFEGDSGTGYCRSCNVEGSHEEWCIVLELKAALAAAAPETVE